MPIIIGEAPGSDFRNPIGLLTDCHRRIETFLEVLEAVTRQARGESLNDEHRHALEVSLRYFRESVPKHAADEEESLFPRMLTSAGSQLPVISGVLESLNSDHRRLFGEHERVDELGRWWLANDFLQPEEVTRLASIIEDLKNTYARHIRIEENDVFPLARQILGPDASHSIATEMAARRKLSMKDFVVSGLGKS